MEKKGSESSASTVDNFGSSPKKMSHQPAAMAIKKGCYNDDSSYFAYTSAAMLFYFFVPIIFILVGYLGSWSHVVWSVPEGFMSWYFGLWSVYGILACQPWNTQALDKCMMFLPKDMVRQSTSYSDLKEYYCYDNLGLFPEVCSALNIWKPTSLTALSLFSFGIVLMLAGAIWLMVFLRKQRRAQPPVRRSLYNKPAFGLWVAGNVFVDISLMVFILSITMKASDVLNVRAAVQYFSLPIFAGSSSTAWCLVAWSILAYIAAICQYWLKNCCSLDNNCCSGVVDEQQQERNLFEAETIEERAMETIEERAHLAEEVENVIQQEEAALAVNMV